jgi:hypothetical protein
MQPNDARKTVNSWETNNFIDLVLEEPRSRQTSLCAARHHLCCFDAAAHLDLTALES